jgi:hypothetical protein
VCKNYFWIFIDIGFARGSDTNSQISQETTNGETAGGCMSTSGPGNFRQQRMYQLRKNG